MAKKRLKLCSVEDDMVIPTQCPKQTQGSSLSYLPDALTREIDEDVDQVDSTQVKICITGGSSTRGKRGITRMSDIWNLPSNQRIMLNYNNYFQPVDKEGSILHRFMGTVVRKPNLAPIDYLSWRKMDIKYKDSCCNHLHAHACMTLSQKIIIYVPFAQLLEEKGIHIWDSNASREYLDRHSPCLRTAVQVLFEHVRISTTFSLKSLPF